MESLEKFIHLKKVNKTGRVATDQQWSLDNLRDGFLYFLKINGRLPTAHEIDKFDFLPSSRQIQRKFGGLEKLRDELNLGGPNNFTKGEYRSGIAKKTYERAVDYEERFYYYLISLIPEIRVHEQHRMRPAKKSVDYFIYTNEFSGVGIDLFYADSVINMQNVVNVKLKTYEKVEDPLYLIVINNKNITQEQIDDSMKNRKSSLPKNIKVLTEDIFINNIRSFVNLEDISSSKVNGWIS